MVGEKRGVGNVSFKWWKKPESPERTISQPQVTDLWIATLVIISLSYGGPTHQGLMGSELKLTLRDTASVIARHAAIRTSTCLASCHWPCQWDKKSYVLTIAPWVPLLF